MNSTIVRQAVPKRIWQMPIVPESYDWHPLLSDEEREALTRYVQDHAAIYARARLARLEQPLMDVMHLRSQDKGRTCAVRKVMFAEMSRRGTTFWAWSYEDWCAVLQPSSKLFLQRHERHEEARLTIMDAAYLLGGFSDLQGVGQTIERTRSANFYFGADLVATECRRVTEVMGGFGYSQKEGTIELIRGVLSLLFLLNRSPYLEDLSTTFMAQVIPQIHSERIAQIASTIRLALYQMGLIDIPEVRPTKNIYPAIIGMAPEWGAWCQSWHQRDTHLTPRSRKWFYNGLMNVGRWLYRSHPAIVSPEQWDEDLALDYVSVVCAGHIGDDISASATTVLEQKGLLGKPFSPRSIDSKLGVLRRFFTDLQDRPHAVGDELARRIAIRFNPQKAFETPSSVKRLIQPDPRDIDLPFWYKLAYAAATLSEEDLVGTSSYPLSYYRAAGLLWVTSARRSNEIARLRVGCVRRDWDPGMLDENGVCVEQETHLCYLHIPSNKTRGPFWIWIPEYTATAIEAWQQERPNKQFPKIDLKDGSRSDFLFCYRNQRMSAVFLNNALIPLLCRKAGIPEADVRGAITSHRARSTIATMLRKRGVSLDDIAHYLGHANSRSVTSYARTDPVQFARTLKKANELDRIVDGLIDPRAATAGRPSVFYFLGRGPDGKPRYCGNPSWVSCAHRMACLKCSMYIGATEAELLEARDGVIKFQAEVRMTPEEKAASDGDIERLNEILEKKRRVPVPNPPTPDYIFNRARSDAHTLQMSVQTETASQLVQLGRKLAKLNRDLAVAEKARGGRNILIRSLKGQIAQVIDQMAEIEKVQIGVDDPT
jgi:integrase